MEKKKNINTKLDDEAVEQLVENRFSSKGEKAHAGKRRKKKKNTGLNILIGVLSFFLVFSIFFLGAYIFFTATPDIEVSEKKVSQTVKKDKESSSDKGLKDNESNEGESSEKTEALKEQSGEKQFSAELDEKAQEEIDRNTKDKVKGSVKPAGTTSTAVKTKAETKKTASEKKETTTKKTETEKASTKTEKAESSTSTVKDKEVVEEKPAETEKPVSSDKADTSQKTEIPDNSDSSTPSTPSDASSENSSDSAQSNQSSAVIDNKDSSEGIIFE